MLAHILGVTDGLCAIPGEWFLWRTRCSPARLRWFDIDRQEADPAGQRW